MERPELCQPRFQSRAPRFGDVSGCFGGSRGSDASGGNTLKNPSPEPCSLQLQTPDFMPQPPKNPSPMPVQPPPHGTPPRGVQCPSLVRGVGVSDAHVWRRADVVQRCVQLGASSAPDKKPPPLPGIDFVQPITAFPQQLIPGCSPPNSGGGSPCAQRRRLVTPIISTAPRLAGHVIDFS